MCEWDSCSSTMSSPLCIPTTRILYGHGSTPYSRKQSIGTIWLQQIDNLLSCQGLGPEDVSIPSPFCLRFCRHYATPNDYFLIFKSMHASNQYLMYSYIFFFPSKSFVFRRRSKRLLLICTEDFFFSFIKELSLSSYSRFFSAGLEFGCWLNWIFAVLVFSLLLD